MNSSYELYLALKNLGYLKDERDEFWWPNSGTFEVVVGAILTQQTKWQKVEKSLQNLKEKNLLDLEKLANIELKELQTLIKPSGFYNTKAKYLKALSQAIMIEFETFENFKEQVSREWLLNQKGVGEETADSILCYACYKPFFVVDSYTNRILTALGYEFETYHDIQEWMSDGLLSHFGEEEIHKVYARFHGKIVEFAKDFIKGKKVDIEVLKLT